MWRYLSTPETVPYVEPESSEAFFAENTQYTVEEWYVRIRSAWKSSSLFATIAQEYLEEVDQCLEKGTFEISSKFVDTHTEHVKHLSSVIHTPSCISTKRRNTYEEEYVHPCSGGSASHAFSSSFGCVEKKSPTLQSSLDVIVQNLAYLFKKYEHVSSDETFMNNIALLSEVKYMIPFIDTHLLYEEILDRNSFLELPPYCMMPVNLTNAKKFYKEIGDLYDFVFSVGRKGKKSSYQTAFGVLEALGLEKFYVPPYTPTLFERGMRLKMYSHVCFLSNVQLKVQLDEHASVGPLFLRRKEQRIIPSNDYESYDIGFCEQSFLF